MGRKRKLCAGGRLPASVASSTGMAAAARRVAATAATGRSWCAIAATASAGRTILRSALPARGAIAAAGVATILRLGLWRGLPRCTRSPKPVPSAAVLRGRPLRRARRILAASWTAKSLPSPAGGGAGGPARGAALSRYRAAIGLHCGPARRAVLGSRGPFNWPPSALALVRRRGLTGCALVHRGPSAATSHGVAVFCRTASSLFQPALLLSERDARRGSGLLVREEPGVRRRVRARRRTRLPVREPQIRARRRHGHLPAKHTRRAHLIARNAPDVVEPAAPEIGGTDPRDAIRHAGVSVDIGYVCVSDIQAPVEACPAIEAPAPPWVQHLIGRQRHPADVAKTEPKPESPTHAVTEESHQRGRPIVPHSHRAGIPAPAPGRIVEPAAIVIRRPAPRVVAHPSPSVPVEPNPAPVSVWRPARIHYRRPPNGAVGRHFAPNAVLIEILSPVHALPNILIAGRTQQRLIAGIVPPVPIVHGIGGGNLELGICGRAASPSSSGPH